MEKNILDFSEKNILVTGASSGIGRETAIFLSQLGARIFLIGRDQSRLEDTCTKLVGTGHQTFVFDLVTQMSELSSFIKGIATNYGALNGMVHCAGMQITKSIKLLEIDEFENIYRANTVTGFALAKAFIQKSVFAAYSSIVFLSSSTAVVGEAGLAAYSSSKSALFGLTKTLAAEFLRYHIRVNCIASGFIKTPLSNQFFESLLPQQYDKLQTLYPLGIGQPEDVAHSIAFLLSNLSRWMTGNILMLDGGRTECTI